MFETDGIRSICFEIQLFVQCRLGVYFVEMRTINHKENSLREILCIFIMTFYESQGGPSCKWLEIQKNKKGKYILKREGENRTQDIDRYRYKGSDGVGMDLAIFKDTSHFQGDEVKCIKNSNTKNAQKDILRQNICVTRIR